MAIGKTAPLATVVSRCLPGVVDCFEEHQPRLSLCLRLQGQEFPTKSVSRE